MESELGTSRATLSKMNSLPLFKAIDSRDSLHSALDSIESLELGDVGPENIQDILEGNVLKSYESIKASMKNAAMEAQKLGTIIGVMEGELDEIYKKILEIEEDSSILIGGCRRNQMKKNLLVNHLKEADDFILSYQLDPRDVKILENLISSRDPSSFEEFCQALAKVKGLSEKCSQALGSGDLGEYPKALIDISEAADSLIEDAYEALCKWIIKMSEKSSGGVDLSYALVLLRDRSTLYTTAIGEISRIRSRAFSAEFLRALTTGGPKGVPKPIDLNAHNPTRYVNDMLARLHISVTTEKDVIDNILISTEEGNSDGKSKMLDTITMSVCGPLIQRIRGVIYHNLDEVLESGSNFIDVQSVSTLFKLAELLYFYRDTFSKLLGVNFSVTKSVDNLFVESTNAIYKKLETILEYMREEEMSSKVLARDDFSTPRILEQMINVIKVIIKEQSHTLISMEGCDSILYSTSEVLRKFVAPLMQKISDLTAKLEKGKGFVFTVNSFRELHSALETVRQAAKDSDRNLIGLIMEPLENEVQGQTEKLVLHITADMLGRCGLKRVLALIDELESDENSQDAAHSISQGLVSASLTHFYSSIPTLELSLTMTHLIIDADTRSSVRRQILENVASSYERLYKFIKNPANSLEETTGMQIHSVQMVYYMLLG